MRIKVDNKLILTTAFVLFFVTDLLFAYTLFSQAVLFVFCGLSVVVLRKIYINPFLISYILLAICSAVNIFFGFAIDKNAATDMTGTLVINCLFLLALTQYCGLINDPVAVLEIYKKICIVVSCFFLVFGLPNVLKGERLSVWGVNANSMSTFAAYSLVIHIYGLYTKKRFTYKDAGIFVLFVAIILLTASRKGLIIPLLGWYVMQCIRQPRKIIKTSLLIIGIVTVGLVLILNVKPLYDVVGYRIEPLLLLLQGFDYEEGSLISRSHYIQYAWDSAQDNLALGHGLDCFRTLPRAFGTYSHCNYLELLFSVGFVGIIAYYSSSIVTLIKLPKALKANKDTVSLLFALLIPFLICDYLSVTYFTRRLLVIPAICVMFIGRCGNEKDRFVLQKSIPTV